MTHLDGRSLPVVASEVAPTSSAPGQRRRRRDWSDELREAITSVEALDRALALTDDERRGALRAEAMGLPLRITPYYLGLVDRDKPDCPIRKQVVPSAAEGVDAPGDLADPLGEEAHTVAPHLVQRYPDRALLLATDRCAIYCRFCTRSRLVGQGGGAVPLAELEPAMAYLEGHPEVRDVIVSGGDPLAMATERITRLLTRLREIPSIETIRLATRVPVALPSRVTAELVRALKRFQPLWVMTHFNHPKELTKQAKTALARLVDGGLPVNNQAVLLRGVNDDAETLTALFRGLVASRVRPYYLLQMDPVRGSSHLRTKLDVGIALMEALQGRLSGIALPKLIVDTPRGMGKVPVGPNYVVAKEPGVTRLRTHRGVVVDYFDPP